MSRLFTTFTSPFPFSNLDEHGPITDLFSDAMQLQTDAVLTTLDRYKIDINSNYCRNDSKQTLLHIAVITKNKSLIIKLIERNIDIDLVDIFGQTSLDLAIHSNRVDIVKLLCSDADKLNILLRENKQLNNDNLSYKKANTQLLEANEIMTKKYNTVRDDLVAARRIHKRTRDNFNHYSRDNKRLRADNSKLLKDNKALQTTVRTLRNKYKK